MVDHPIELTDGYSIAVATPGTFHYDQIVSAGFRPLSDEPESKEAPSPPSKTGDTAPAQKTEAPKTTAKNL